MNRKNDLIATADLVCVVRNIYHQSYDHMNKIVHHSFTNIHIVLNVFRWRISISYPPKMWLQIQIVRQKASLMEVYEKMSKLMKSLRVKNWSNTSFIIYLGYFSKTIGSLYITTNQTRPCVNEIKLTTTMLHATHLFRIKIHNTNTKIMTSSGETESTRVFGQIRPVVSFVFI